MAVAGDVADVGRLAAGRAAGAHRPARPGLSGPPARPPSEHLLPGGSPEPTGASSWSACRGPTGTRVTHETAALPHPGGPCLAGSDTPEHARTSAPRRCREPQEGRHLVGRGLRRLVRHPGAEKSAQIVKNAGETLGNAATSFATSSGRSSRPSSPPRSRDEAYGQRMTGTIGQPPLAMPTRARKDADKYLLREDGRSSPPGCTGPCSSCRSSSPCRCWSSAAVCWCSIRTTGSPAPPVLVVVGVPVGTTPCGSARVDAALHRQPPAACC